MTGSDGDVGPGIGDQLFGVVVVGSRVGNVELAGGLSARPGVL